MMDTIYVMMLVFMTGFFCVLSFAIGVFCSFGRKINLNPIETYKENKEIKEQIKISDLERRQFATMMENINIYDGSSTGQKDIPNE